MKKHDSTKKHDSKRRKSRHHSKTKDIVTSTPETKTASPAKVETAPEPPTPTPEPASWGKKSENEHWLKICGGKFPPGYGRRCYFPLEVDAETQTTEDSADVGTPPHASTQTSLLLADAFVQTEQQPDFEDMKNSIIVQVLGSLFPITVTVFDALNEAISFFEFFPSITNMTMLRAFSCCVEQRSTLWIRILEKGEPVIHKCVVLLNV